MSVPNVPVCFELDISRGYCVNTVDQEGFYVDDSKKLYEKTWWELRPSMVMVPYQSWEDIKLYFAKNCKKTEKCQELDKFTKSFEKKD